MLYPKRHPTFPNETYCNKSACNLLFLCHFQGHLSCNRTLLRFPEIHTPCNLPIRLSKSRNNGHSYYTCYR